MSDETDHDGHRAGRHPADANTDTVGAAGAKACTHNVAVERINNANDHYNLVIDVPLTAESMHACALPREPTAGSRNA